jgi:hypothetical protein
LMTRAATWSKLKAWAVAVAKRRGAKRAKVALARKIGVILYRMRIDARCGSTPATSASPTRTRLATR